MDIASITNNFRLSEWMQVLKDQKSSGMTVNDFCLSRGIKRHSFYYWQRKLRETAVSELQKNAAVVGNQIPAGWLQLTQEVDTEATIEVMVNGFSINVGADTNPELLKKVCTILRSVL